MPGMGGSIGGGLSYDQIVSAFIDALNAAGGGGGGGEPFPDSTVQGTALFVIPVGFNAIARVVNAGTSNILINGNVVHEQITLQVPRLNMSTSINIGQNGGVNALSTGGAGSVGSMSTPIGIQQLHHTFETYKLLEGDTFQFTNNVIDVTSRYHIELYAI